MNIFYDHEDDEEEQEGPQDESPSVLAVIDQAEVYLEVHEGIPWYGCVIISD